MKYICLVYGEEARIQSIRDQECINNSTVMKQRGQFIGGEALRPVGTARTVRVRDGRLSVTDGPFTETKEQLAGFYIIEAGDWDEAVAIAAAIPPARVGCVEVRPVRELQPDA